MSGDDSSGRLGRNASDGSSGGEKVDEVEVMMVGNGLS